jgi:DNA-binding Xre family transcriptional regulator
MKDPLLEVTHNRKFVDHFRIQLAQKATKQKQNIALMDVKQESEIAWSTLNSWANNQVTRHYPSVIQVLCEYFGCQLCNLLIFKTATND